RLSVFFFQAEDGIRGGHVTGVQTCALPIFRMPILFADAAEDCSRLFGWALLDEVERHESGTRFSFSDWRPLTHSSTQELVLVSRSEERRVGKECRQSSVCCNYIMREFACMQ